MSQIALVSRSDSRFSSTASNDEIHLQQVGRCSTDSGLGIDNVCFTIEPEDTGSFKENQNKNEPEILPSADKKSTEHTYWSSLWLADIMCFFMSISFTMFFPTLWPFLNSIDSSTDETFLGYVVAIYSFGQAIASPLMGFWSNKIKKTKPPIAVGIILMFIANGLYFFTPAFPQSSRKWVLLFARFLCGFGAGVIAVLRAYVAASSSSKDRATAMSLISGAFALGMTFGPAIQAMFTPIGYPGLQLGIINVDMYTAAALFSMVIDVGLLILLFVMYKDHQMDTSDSDNNMFYALPKYDKLAASIIIFAWFVYMIAFTNAETVQTPYTMAMYDWNDSEASEYNSIILACQGGVALLFTVFYAVKLCKICDPRKLIIFGLGLITIFHVLTFPWPFYEERLSYQLTKVENITTNKEANQFFVSGDGDQNQFVGCGLHMKWCEWTPRVPKWLFIISFVLLPGIGFPALNAPIATLLSKIIGPRKQGTVFGYMLLVGGCARIIGPMLIMQIFTNFGAGWTWAVEGCLMLMGMVPCLIWWKRLIPLKIQAEMKAGDSFTYKRGTFYKF